MRILIAGASGFIGGRIASFLADEGFEVIALCNKNIPDDPIWRARMFKVIQCDIFSFDTLVESVGPGIDGIINLISLDHFDSNGEPDFVNRVNVLPTWNFLHNYAKNGLQFFIYLSTIHVYGNQLNGIIDESIHPSPVNQYGLTHLLSEQIVNLYANNSPVRCYNIRLSNGFGAPQFMKAKCWDLVINNLCLSAWKNQKLVLKSDGTPLRDFIHISNLMNGIKQILTDKTANTKSSTINFSSEQTISMLDAAMLVKKAYEAKYDQVADVFINVDQPVLAHTITGSDKYIIDNAKFLQLLGGQAINDITFGINEIFDFLDDHKKRTNE